ncbi:MAG: 2-amino-4-hydroxy-6-hydroxymethyldihydropteridine diphosphokinase [Aquificae bacterium]|nr:2-amino-4-hydroxy-6-hydroxymethyldihydropteridine diphosphokinase [Aquificota bacterium]
MGKSRRPALVVVAYGCNRGDCPSQIERALLSVRREVFVRGVSKPVVSEPYGVKNQPPFLNGVLFGYTRLAPFALLRFLKAVEREVGRKPRCRWCEREIDLDLIYYDDLVLEFEELKVPHPDRLNRPFVLGPLAELLPTFVDPLVRKTVRQLYGELKEKGKAL